MMNPDQYDPMNGGPKDDDGMDALIAGTRLGNGDAYREEDFKPLNNGVVGRIYKRLESFLEEQNSQPEGKRISRAKIARDIGVSPTTLGEVINRKYPGRVETRDAILRKIDRFLDRVESQENAPERTGFVWTRVAEEIRAVACTTVALKCMGLMHGPAGIGKTLTLSALIEQMPGTIFLTISEDITSPNRLYGELDLLIRGRYQAMGKIQYKANVVRRLKGSGRLIVVDEADQASFALLNAIRQLHDSTGCPVLLSGLPELARKLLKGRGDDAIGAKVFSRIGVSRDLTERCHDENGGEPLYSKEDIQTVFSQYQMRIAPDAEKFLWGLSNDPDAGGLRAANNILRMAVQILQSKGEELDKVTLSLLRQAARYLLGFEGIRIIEERLQQSRSVGRVACGAA